MNKLIKLSEDHYIIVDNSEININNWYWTPIKRSIEQCVKKLLIIKGGQNDIQQFKITHSTQPLEKIPIDVQMITSAEECEFINIKPLNLSEVEELIYGYSVDKMAKKWFLINQFNQEDMIHSYKVAEYITTKNLWKKGFNAHKELLKDKNKKVIELLKNITEWSSFKQHPIGKQAQKALDLLLSPTEWNVKFNEQGKLELL